MQYWIYGKMTKTRNQLVLCLLFVLVLMLWRRIIIMYIYECGECVHLKKGGCYNNTYLNNNGFWGTSSRDEENHIILLFTRKRDGCAVWCASRVHVQTTVHYSFLLGKGTLKCTFSKKKQGLSHIIIISNLILQKVSIHIAQVQRKYSCRHQKVWNELNNPVFELCAWTPHLLISFLYSRFFLSVPFKSCLKRNK